MTPSRHRRAVRCRKRDGRLLDVDLAAPRQEGAASRDHILTANAAA